MAKATRSSTRTTGRTTGRSKSAASKRTSKAASTPKAASTVPDDSDFDDYDDLDGLDELNELQELNELEAAAEEAAAAAAAAKAAYIARRRQAQQAASAKGTANSSASAQPKRKSPLGFGESDDYLGMLSQVFENMSSNDWDSDKFDDMSQGVGMVLGSGPAFAALGSMLANSTAQGSVLMNATQMQRQLDQVGLCCTSACVKQLLSMNDPRETE